MIVLTNVHKSYDGGATYAVRDVSLKVEEGQMLVLLGTTGCGKTTTLKMINRLIDPTAGSVEVNGQDVRAADPVQLRRTIGYVVQGNGLFPHLTVADNIAVVPKLLGWPADRIRRRVDELLEMVRLPRDFRSKLPRQLSGGQQQRVGFARALAARPRLMLLDEPFGALDPLTRDALREDFLKVRKELGLTAVMVTHDMTEALLSADVIAVMRGVEVEKDGRKRSEGRLVRLGTPHELLTDPGEPFVEELMSVPRHQAAKVAELAAGHANRRLP
ncbi:MAG TPA: ABC transporter ATP-binding protein [Gemmataceae bacterium]|nr:ABC transporter ATP-binding protein [Gemmataceae bacterium]